MICPMLSLLWLSHHLLHLSQKSWLQDMLSSLANQHTRILSEPTHRKMIEYTWHILAYFIAHLCSPKYPAGQVGILQYASQYPPSFSIPVAGPALTMRVSTPFPLAPATQRFDWVDLHCHWPQPWENFQRQ